LVDAISESVECGLELFPADLPILIGVKLFNEDGDLILKGWESVGLKEKLLHFITGDEATVIDVNALESRLEFFV
jgi:hypothetical protein